MSSVKKISVGIMFGAIILPFHFRYDRLRENYESTAIVGTWDHSPIPTRSPDLTLKEILFRTLGPF